MTASRKLGWGARAIWGSMVALLLVSAVGSFRVRAEATGIRKIGTLPLALPKDANRSLGPNYNLIMDPSIRRAYQLIKLEDTSTIGRVFNLDTGKVVLQRKFARSHIPQGPAAPHTAPVSSEWVAQLDSETHQLYVAYTTNGLFGGVTIIDAPSMKVLRSFARKPVYLDPDTLGCASANCVPQTPAAAPTAVAIWPVSPDFVSGQHKVLILMQEPRTSATENNFSIQWLAQWDAITGNQDWTYRIAACQNSQLADASVSANMAGLFQGRFGIYVGCLASGGTGQVVQMPVDGSNKPTTELAFPGPLQGTDFMLDPDAEHMLLRVTTSKGDSYWVFEGSAQSAYTGVMGFTLGQTPLASGIDTTTGRMYLLSGPTEGGGERNAGGLQMSDSRRAPAPQPLQFPEYARAAGGKILADTNPFTGQRRVFVLSGGEKYDVYEDNVPLSLNGGIGDLDALTTDVPEEPGVTDRSFAGIAHAYGLRALLVGGLEGAPTTGPNVGYRVGRHVPKWVGSPCGRNDRELTIGAVREGKLSSSSVSASASVAEADPGTKADIGQPEQRCYPRPMALNQDVWGLIQPFVGGQDYPRPLDRDSDGDATSDIDEYAGTLWPFSVAECSGDSDDTTKTKIKPLDRGGDESVIPKDLRGTALNAENYSAAVHCNQKKSKLDADAGGMAFQSPEIPGLGKITVGRVSSHTKMFLDPTRGFVVRTVAEANHIEIGDHILLDKAATVAETVAAGRSGSAVGTFTRKLCGLHIKDELPEQHPHEPDIQVNPDDPTHPHVDPTGGPEIVKSVDIDGCGDPGLGQLGNQPIIDAINRVLGSRGRASAPQPDGPFQQGSPGGYIAAIVKDALAKISSEAVSGDASSEVPALEITIFNDDPDEGRGRQIYQFAGVDATSTYQIFLLNPEQPTFEDPPLPPVDPVAPIVTVDNPPPPPPPPSSGARGPITLLFAGIGFLLRSPLDALLAASVWMILYSPAKLATRRRALALARTIA